MAKKNDPAFYEDGEDGEGCTELVRPGFHAPATIPHEETAVGEHTPEIVLPHEDQQGFEFDDETELEVVKACRVFMDAKAKQKIAKAAVDASSAQLLQSMEKLGLNALRVRADKKTFYEVTATQKEAAITVKQVKG